MDKYLDSFRDMISLRGLTSHTLKNYCTYIRAYLDYLSNILHKTPEDVSWDELRDYIRWLQKSRDFSDRTINCAISQLRFFTMYVLHKTWDDTQLPMRRFDEYLPYVPSKEETWQFISSMPDLKPKTMVTLMYSSAFASEKSAGSAMKMSTAKICGFTSHTLKAEMTGMPFFQKRLLAF